MIVTYTQKGRRKQVSMPPPKDVISKPSRADVLAYEEMLRALPQVEMPVIDHFSEGVYARELFIPKGTTLTGKIHKFTNLNIMISGELSVLTEDGVKRVTAPFVVVSPPGTKRVAYAHEDTRWITVHGTTETDIEKIEYKFIAQSEQEYLAFCDEQKLLKG